MWKRVGIFDLFPLPFWKGKGGRGKCGEKVGIFDLFPRFPPVLERQRWLGEMWERVGIFDLFPHVPPVLERQRWLGEMWDGGVWNFWGRGGARESLEWKVGAKMEMKSMKWFSLAPLSPAAPSALRGITQEDFPPLTSVGTASMRDWDPQRL